MNTRFIALLLACFFALPLLQNAQAEINLHVFLHSHNDLGWIYTMNQYYQGAGGQEGGCVKCLLNNVFESLGKNKNRKYMFAEVGFFKMWWNEQNEARKERFRQYVKDGQFIFVNGGWGSNDEACAYYDDIIDQMIIGHRYLKDVFDIYPTTGWQIDPFGHSKTHAALMAQMGIQGLFIGRIDYQDWEKRRKDQTLEFNWKTGAPNGDSTFTHVLFVHYSDTKFMIPDNFNCRSIFCYGRLTEDRKRTVADWIKMQANSFKTSHVAMLVGDDFHLWRESEKDFDGIEDMIKSFNSDSKWGIKAKFSSLPEYMDDFRAEYKSKHANEPLPTKRDDFFPYIENPWTSWVGYFTSKSMFKHRVREASQFLHTAKTLMTKFMLMDNSEIYKNDQDTHSKYNDAFNTLEEALAVIQHHDGIAATMKEFVRADYDNMMENGINKINNNVVIPALTQYLKLKFNEDVKLITANDHWLYKDPRFNTLFTEKKPVLVHVFNPGEKGKLLVKIKVASYKFSVVDEFNNPIPVDIICNSDDAMSDCYMYFVDTFAGYSQKSYKVHESPLSKRIVPVAIKSDITLELENQATFTVKSNLKDFEYKICPDTDPFNLDSQLNRPTCLEDQFSLNYEYYESYPGGGGAGQVASGMYVFRPKNSNKQNHGTVKSGRVFQGRYITLVQIFRDTARTDLRFVHHELRNGIYVDTHLEGLPRGGIEVVMMVRSKRVQDKKNVFFTDANGYLMQRRQKDYRECFESKPAIDVANNYYPITSAMFIQNPETKQRLTIMTDRAQGVTSLNPGEFEIMIHRTCVADDWKGASEVLNERENGAPIKVSTRHILTYSSTKEPGHSHLQRKLQYRLDRPLKLWFFSTPTPTFSSLALPAETGASLAKNVKITFRSYKLNEFVVRLHNLDEEKTTQVTLYDLRSRYSTFLSNLAQKNVKIAEIQELSLLTTRLRSEVPKNDLDPEWHDDKPEDGPQYSTISLRPYEIRTFLIKIAKN